MTDLLPSTRRLSISHITGQVTAPKMAVLDHLLIFIPDNLRAAGWKKLPSGASLLALQKRIRSKTAIPAAETRLRNNPQTGISIALMPADLTAFKRLDLARRHLAHALRSNPSRLGILVTGFDDAVATATAEAAVASALAAIAPLPSEKSKPEKPPRLRALSLFGQGEPDVSRLRAENEGNHLARWLTTLPANRLDSAGYRKLVTALAERNKWEMEFLDRKALARRGAGAFLAVAQAGDTDAGIVHLRYRTAGAKKQPDLALVGKGICFDTGGVNLKPAQHMQNMHDDMQGSAVALGVLTALTRMNSEMNIDCWLAISENLISPLAYKPSDVVTAADGTTIEIVHSDAEGRMVLADTLALAAAAKPAIIIDYATLTGACVVATTTRYSGAFTNRQALNPVLLAAGADCGERVWPFPMDDDFDAALSSGIADIKQCSLDGGGDHILAARFLSRFAGSGPWIHIDLASGRHKGGLGHIPSDVTGFGVRFTLNLLDEQKLLQQVRD